MLANADADAERHRVSDAVSVGEPHADGISERNGEPIAEPDGKRLTERRADVQPERVRYADRVVNVKCDADAEHVGLSKRVHLGVAKWLALSDGLVEHNRDCIAFGLTQPDPVTLRVRVPNGLGYAERVAEPESKRHAERECDPFTDPNGLGDANSQSDCLCERLGVRQRYEYSQC